MNRLNYFNPYQSKEGHYEDQLTRAYLVLLKHSFHSFSLFIDYCKNKQVVDLAKDEKPISLIELIEKGWELDTQKGNPLIESNWLLSVLITDSTKGLSTANTVAPSERNARYDGIITFGDALTIIIENKPYSGNVWFEQLNPSTEGLSEETRVYSKAVHLEWKDIITQLNHLLNLPTLSGYEKIMIEDFLSYIDEKFMHLNPYDSFHLCKGNTGLIQRRIQNLLKSIVIDENLVRYHNGWGFFIQTPYEAITKIGLILGTKDNKWWLELSLYFGDTQSQAKVFYNAKPTIAHFGGDWWFVKNFHVSFRSSNLVWFNKGDNHTEYLQFWQENIDEIYQRKRNEVPEFIEWLKEEGVVKIEADDDEKLDDSFYETAMQTLNICPGFGAIYEISAEDAEQLDKKQSLKKVMIDAIKEGLKIINKDGNEFLKRI